MVFNEELNIQNMFTTTAYINMVGSAFIVNRVLHDQLVNVHYRSGLRVQILFLLNVEG